MKHLLSLLLFYFIILSLSSQTQPNQPINGPGGTNYTHTGVNMYDFTTLFGADGYWLFEPTSPVPDSADVIIFNHAYGVFNPGPYGAWIEHLVKKGNIVIFPKFQNSDVSLPSTYTPNAVTGIQDAINELNNNTSYVRPRWEHLAMIGHSYGGVVSANIAVEYTNYGVPKPDCIMLCQPGTGGINTGRLASYTGMDSDYNMLIIVGDDDIVVGDSFGWEIMNTTSIPDTKKNLIVHYADNYGNGIIEASHNEPLAKDNTYDGGVTSTIIASAYTVSKEDPVDYYCYWKLADALMSCTFYGTDCNYTFGDTYDQKNMGLWGDSNPVIPLEVFPKSTVTASCKNIDVYLDILGNATILPSDLDNGSSTTSPPINYTASQTSFNCNDLLNGAPTNDMVITGVIDGPLSGGTPKAIELYVFNNINDLSQYGIGSANNGGGSDGQEFTFPAISATAGQFIYISYDSAQFSNWFGFPPDYTAGAAQINGDDAVELFYMGNVIDVFGDINVDGNGEPWEYLDGWAYRTSQTGPDGNTYNLGNWTFSGPNSLDGETMNSTATNPFPLGSYIPVTIGQVAVTLYVIDQSSIPDSCQSLVTVLDTISPTISCPSNQAISCDSLMPDFTSLGMAIDNCSSSSFITQFPLEGATPTGQVTLTASDAYGNTGSCTFNLTFIDTVAPSIICPSDQNVSLDTNCQFILPDYTLTTTSMDNCDLNPTLSQNPSAGTALTNTGSVTLTSTDLDGNTNSCSFLILIDSSANTINETACDSYTAPDGQTYTSSGQYTAIIPNSIGCDSTITINLTVNTVDVNVTQAGIQLTADATGASYQWLECITGIPNGFSLINGETNQSFTPTANGSYAVEIIMNGCTDTSICYTISNVGLENNNMQTLIIYPNPNNGNIHITSTIPLNNATITITDLNGKVILYKRDENGTDFHIPFNEPANGVYFLEVINDKIKSRTKIIKQ